MPTYPSPWWVKMPGISFKCFATYQYLIQSTPISPLEGIMRPIIQYRQALDIPLLASYHGHVGSLNFSMTWAGPSQALEYIKQKPTDGFSFWIGQHWIAYKDTPPFQSHYIMRAAPYQAHGLPQRKHNHGPAISNPRGRNTTPLYRRPPYCSQGIFPP